MARRSVIWALAAILVFLGGATVVVILRQTAKAPPQAPQARAAPDFDRIYLKDVVYSSYVRGQKAFTLAADEILHRRRRLGPLTINPLKEVEMNGVRIEIFPAVRGEPSGAAPGESQDLDLPIASILKESLASKDLGFVSRVLLNRFHLSVLRDGAEQIGLEAGKASVGLDSKALRLEDGVTLSTVKGERLEAQRAEWRFDSRRFHFPESYVETEGGSTRRGQGDSFRIALDGRLIRDAGSPAEHP